MANWPLRLRTDWVVAVSREGAHIGSAVAALTATSGSGSAPSDEGPIVWTDQPARCAVVAWRRDDLQGTSWHITPDGITLVSGQLRWSGQRWSDPGRWASDLANRRASNPWGHPLEGLVGDGTAVAMTPSGRGIVAADQLGLASVFRASNGDLEVFASSAELAARAVAPDGRRPPKDVLAGAWFAYAGHLVSAGTSFAGVERLPAGAAVRIDPTRGSSVLTLPRPWSEQQSLEGLTEEALLDVAEEAILDGLTAAADLDTGRPLVDLTGGKDSRLVVAVAIRRSDIRKFRVFTAGAPDFPDVAIARQISEFLGFEHESGFRLRSRGESYADRASRFIHLTAGMNSAWTLVLPDEGAREVRVSATSGEMLRAHAHERAWASDPRRTEQASARGAAEFLISVYRSGAGFLLPETRMALEAVLRDYFESLASSGIPATDLMATYFVDHHGRKFAGRRLELESDHRILGLIDPTAVRAAHRLGTDRRRQEYLHYSLITRTSPVMSSLPFAVGAWEFNYPTIPLDELRSHRAESSFSTSRSSGGSRPASIQPPARPSEPWSFLGVAQSKPDNERREFIADCFSDTNNEIWQVADRSLVLEAVSQFDELPMKQRQQLYGLATGAVWVST